ncbi:MAG TPA: 3TM-type holin, partial [Burkholderiaceae bacterium]|nr:3TM-type holin [Burkholderiaceae bacterium]
DLAQVDVNKAEASSASVFVAGWRPFIGWVCGAACAWNWLGLSVAKFAFVAAGHPVNLNPADLSEMWPLLLGMLGIGGMRTFEKVKGVTK